MIDPDHKEKGSGGETQSSGGAASSSEEAQKIINKRQPLTDEEMANALEWKPWYYVPEAPKPRKSPAPTKSFAHKVG
jgi:hypothetical protein